MNNGCSEIKICDKSQIIMNFIFVGLKVISLSGICPPPPTAPPSWLSQVLFLVFVVRWYIIFELNYSPTPSHAQLQAHGAWSAPVAAQLWALWCLECTHVVSFRWVGLCWLPCSVAVLALCCWSWLCDRSCCSVLWDRCLRLECVALHLLVRAFGVA